MGAWGFRNFENDDAGDWVVYFMSNPKWEFVLNTFESYEKESFKVTDEEVLAAAEVVAITQNNPPIDFHEVGFNLAQVVEKLDKPPSNNLVDHAIRIVERILQESDLKERIEEVNAIAKWTEIMLDLVKRIKNEY